LKSAGRAASLSPGYDNHFRRVGGCSPTPGAALCRYQCLDHDAGLWGVTTRCPT
jgi:hypothetical protein